MATYGRRVKVTKTEAYELELSDWLGPESLTTVSADSDALTTIVDSVIDGTKLKFRLTGVTAGKSSVLLTFATATRTNCTTRFVEVVENCSLPT